MDSRRLKGFKGGFQSTKGSYPIGSRSAGLTSGVANETANRDLSGVTSGFLPFAFLGAVRGSSFS